MAITNIKVNGYDDEFNGIIKYNNQTFKLNNVIDQEEVQIELSKDGKCSLKKVINPSSFRVNPKCSIFNRCGGCALQHIDYKHQLEMKTELVENLYFNEYNKVFNVKPTIGMANPWNYRNKNQVVVKYSTGSKIMCGFYEEGTHKVVEIDECVIQDDYINKIITYFKELMVKMHYQAYNEDRHTGLIRYLLIKRSEKLKEVLVCIVTAQEVFPGCQNLVKALTAKFKEIKTIIQNINNRNNSAVLGEKEKIIWGKGYICDNLLGNVFRIGSKTFYQINSLQTEVLYKKAIELANLKPTAVLLDAYCGVGTIGLYASKFVKKVIGVEIGKDSVNNAIMNAKANNIKNATFFCDDASNFIKNLALKKEHIDCIVMDPPRKGSDERFINSIIKLAPKKIIYISCDPRTQVTDIKKLIDFGYTIEVIQPVDMFPHTFHVETVVCLNKIK